MSRASTLLEALQSPEMGTVFVRMRTAPTHEAVDTVTGYMHPRYAWSHQEFGVPRELPLSRGWIVERRIPGLSDSDAMGCYPMFACANWSQLHQDLSHLPESLVSLCLVTDPFGEYDEAYLRRCFPDLAVPFKEHYVIDLSKPRNLISKHHRKEARRACRQLRIEIHPNPPAFLDSWMNLHAHLVAKHTIKGIAAFSRAAFAEQLSTPGIRVLFASFEGQPVAATLYFMENDVAHGHILGYSDVGLELGALYGLIWSAMDAFAGSVRWINLMGVPGAQDTGGEGIRRFKEGWTRDTRTAWLCGRILNRARYAEIVRSTGTARARYFPAYRDGEMALVSPEKPVAATGSESSKTS
jgi:hypothetical protein